jgi:hypothetical protein
MRGLKFLLGAGEHFGSQKLEDSDEPTRSFVFPESELRLAIEKGHTELLAEIIRRTGAGLPLEQLVKHTGVELGNVEKRQYYEGLTVYGKKRKDWAAAGRRATSWTPRGLVISPLIVAAMAGSISSVEWFLSDAPLRHYLAFAQSRAAREDVRLQHLRQAPGGIDGAVSTWLSGQAELVLHGAILAPPQRTTDELVAYLVKAYPDTVNSEVINTVPSPLFLATTLGRVEIVRILLDAGADPASCKGPGTWSNLMHAALEGMPTAAQLGPLLKLFDASLVRRMMGERDSLSAGGCTPLHRWLRALTGYVGAQLQDKPDEMVAVLNLLREYSAEAPPPREATPPASDSEDDSRQASSLPRELRLLDATGETVLHTVMRNSFNPALVSALLDIPGGDRLLYREDAVGRTPSEVAYEKFLSEKVLGRVNRNTWGYRDLGARWDGKQTAARTYSPLSDLATKSVEDFVKPSSESDNATTVERLWDLCRGRTEAKPADGSRQKRRLVTLHEANDVARRLGEVHTKTRYTYKLVGNRTRDGDVRTEGQEEGEADQQASRKEDRLKALNYRFSSPPYKAWMKPLDEESKPAEPKYTVPLCRGCGQLHH